MVGARQQFLALEKVGHLLAAAALPPGNHRFRHESETLRSVRSALSNSYIDWPDAIIEKHHAGVRRLDVSERDLRVSDAQCNTIHPRYSIEC